MKRRLLILAGCTAAWAAVVAVGLFFVNRKLAQAAGWVS